MIVHPYLSISMVPDIFAMQDDANTAYFRESREARFGRKLEELGGHSEQGLEAFRKSLEPVRSMLSYQPYIGGGSPLFPDYIVFGALQWARVASPYPYLEAGDPVARWFEGFLDLFGGMARSVPAAA